jgi:hypothetical protein
MGKKISRIFTIDKQNNRQGRWIDCLQTWFSTINVRDRLGLSLLLISILSNDRGSHIGVRLLFSTKNDFACRPTKDDQLLVTAFVVHLGSLRIHGEGEGKGENANSLKAAKY